MDRGVLGRDRGWDCHGRSTPHTDLGRGRDRVRARWDRLRDFLTIAVLSTAYDRPGTATDLAVWCGGLGFMALLAGAILTLIALGRRGRHQFLLVLAVTTLTIATYEFWTSNWAARYGDVSDRCFYAALAPGAGVQRVPPGVRCIDPGDGEEVFVPADAICWLALGGWSLVYGFAASFPVMAIGWAARRRGGTVLDFPG
jgi:transposase InsO family protein